MGIFDRFRRNVVEDPEKTRREHLLKNGRLTDGVIIESDEAENVSELVRYEYWVHGVNFESSDFLTDEQQKDPVSYAPGASVGIRFDPRNHGNSIIV